jgi:hypothetical protein
MVDPKHLREQARRCRGRSKTATEPDLIEQFRIWSVELADEADTVERRAVNGETHRSSGRRGLSRRLIAKKRRAGRGI